jgi:hypothetical protein
VIYQSLQLVSGEVGYQIGGEQEMNEMMGEDLEKDCAEKELAKGGHSSLGSGDRDPWHRTVCWR